MNPCSFYLALVLIPCFVLRVHASCDKDSECHYGRCCAGHCIWHHNCPCVNDNDCRSGEKCSSIRMLGHVCQPTDKPTVPTLTTFTHRFWHHDHESHPTPKTKTSNKQEEHKSGSKSWRYGSKVIIISCLVAVAAVIVCVYFVFKKARKRPESTRVTVLSPHATHMEMMTRGAATTGACATVLQMQPGSEAGATAMEVEAGPCPFKAPGVLPPYYSLEFKPQETEEEEPPPSYDDAVKPSVVAMEQ